MASKSWVEIQKKTFTGWANSHLKKVSSEIQDIKTDLRSGIILCQLLEIIGDDKIRYSKKPKHKLHMIENLNTALKFIESRNVKLTAVGSEDIYDGNLKLILGLIWMLILRFEIEDISVEELSAKEGLLLWCQRKTEGYKGVKVTNFTTSWQDGLAFNALIHRHRPDLLNFDELEKANRNENLDQAFNVAEKELDIPRLFDPTDLTEVAKPDERSIVTYVSFYFKAFASKMQEETAARRISKLIAMQQGNEEMANDYNTRARALLEWIKEKQEYVKQREFDNTLAGIQEKITDFKNYKRSEKRPKALEKAELEALFNSINAKLRYNQRPEFIPEEGLEVQTIGTEWETLVAEESVLQKDLLEELQRQETITQLLSKLESRKKRLEKWFVDAEKYLEEEISCSSLGDAVAKMTAHDARVAEYDAMKKKIGVVGGIADELVALDYQEKDEIASNKEEMTTKYEDFQGKLDEKKDVVQKEIDKHQETENLKIEFSKKAVAFNEWLEESAEVIHEPVTCESLVEAEKKSADHQQVIEEMSGSAAEDIGGLKEISGKMEELGVTDNPYTTLKIDTLSERYEELKTRAEERTNEIEQELTVQQNNQQKKEVFEEKAGALLANVAEYKEKVNSGNAEAELDEQLKEMKDISSDISSEVEPKFTELATEFEELEDLGITETDPPVEAVEEEFKALQKLAEEKIKTIEQQIASKMESEVSPEQIQEFSETFKLFDKDNSNSLEGHELKACISSLGADLTDEQVAELMKEYSGGESMGFDEFVQFMINYTKDSDSPDQIKDSFKVIAGEKPFITEDQLRANFQPEEVEFMLSKMPEVEGGYDYNMFTDSMYS